MVEREVLHLTARGRDPLRRRGQEEQQAHDDAVDRQRDGDDGDGQTDRIEDREDARRRHVDLLAHRRRLDELVGAGHHCT
jgi:hypothetical protein